MHTKTIIYLFCFLFSSTAFTQIQNGGGPDEDFIKKLEQYKHVADTHKTLIASLNKKWQKCGNNSSLEFRFLSEIYLQLTWRNPAVTCEEDKKKTILTCFYDDKTKADIQVFINNSNARAYLLLTDVKEQVDPVLEYFTKMSKE